MRASDKKRDIAVVGIGAEKTSSFQTLRLGNSDQVQVGEEVVAIGNPLSLESTVSNGIVSGMRTADELGGKFLQITAPISPGSSGGPLFNMAGEVVGITTMHIKGGENLNFAIPINDAKHVLPDPGSDLQPVPNEPPNETPSRASKPRPGPQLHASLQQQKMCAEQSDNYVEKTHGEYRSVVTFTSHFDPETSTCYVMTEVHHPDPEKNELFVTDAFEGRHYGTYAPIDTKTFCWVSPRGKGYTPCESRIEFEVLANKYFGID